MVKVGDHNLERDERSQQNIDPEKFFVHEDYVDRKFENDIALIKLKEKVELLMCAFVLQFSCWPVFCLSLTLMSTSCLAPLAIMAIPGC